MLIIVEWLRIKGDVLVQVGWGVIIIMSDSVSESEVNCFLFCNHCCQLHDIALFSSFLIIIFLERVPLK